jgi:hypothetical protein
MDIYIFIIILWKLLAAHAVTDCLLQDAKFSSVSINKRRSHGKSETSYEPDWMYWLWSHGCLNGVGVWIVTGSPMLGLAESVCHSIIDHGKCEGFYGLHIDQAMHFFCKIVWAVIFISWVS